MKKKTLFALEKKTEKENEDNICRRKIYFYEEGKTEK